MSDDIKAKVEITTSYDGSGVKEAKADLAGLDAAGKSVQESIGGVQDALKQLDSGASDASKALVPMNDEAAKMADALDQAGTTIEEVNDNLGDHVQALQAAEEGQKQLSAAIQETAKQLQIATPQMQQLTEGAQNLSTSVQPAIDSMTELQQAMLVPQIPDYILNLPEQPIQRFAQKLGELPEPAKEATAQVTELNDALQQQQQLLAAAPEQLQLPAAAAQKLAESMLPPDVAAQLSSAIEDNWVPPEVPVKTIILPDISNALSREQLTPEMADQFLGQANAIESTAVVLPLQEGGGFSSPSDQVAAIDELVRQQKAMQTLQDVGGQALAQLQSQSDKAAESFSNLNANAQESSNTLVQSGSDIQATVVPALDQASESANNAKDGLTQLSSTPMRNVNKNFIQGDQISQLMGLPPGIDAYTVYDRKQNIVGAEDLAGNTLVSWNNKANDFVINQANVNRALQATQDQSNQTAQAVGGLQQAAEGVNNAFTSTGDNLQANVIPPLDQATKSANDLAAASSNGFIPKAPGDENPNVLGWQAPGGQLTAADIVNNALGIDTARNKAIQDQIDQNPFVSNPPDWQSMGTTLTPDQLSTWQQFAGAGNPIPQQIADAITNLNASSQQAGNSIANNLTPPMQQATNQANDFNAAFSNLTDAQQQAFTGGQNFSDFFASLNPQQQAQWSSALGLDSNGNIIPSQGSTGGQQRSFQDFFNSLPPEQQDNWKQYAGGGGALPPGVNPTDLGGNGESGGGGFFSDLFSNIKEGTGNVFGAIGDGIGGIGETFDNMMTGFDSFMRPLMFAQMAVQMGSQAAQWVYNANAQAEGPVGQANPYSYTSQASLLAANFTGGANQFAVGIGQGLLPSIEGWNAGAGASGQDNPGLKAFGDILGGTAGLLGSGILDIGGLGAMGLGGLISLFGGPGSNLTNTGQSWLTSGGEGAANTIAVMLGQKPIFTTPADAASLYAGQDATAAYAQSHYVGTTSPYDPMNTYQSDVARYTASPMSVSAYNQAIGSGSGPGMFYTAPNADVAADWQYFNSMPIGGGPSSSYESPYQQQYATGPGGTYTQQDVQNQMNNMDNPVGNFLSKFSIFGMGGNTNAALGGGSVDNTSGGGSAADWTTNTAIPAIGKFFGGVGQGFSDWWNSIGTGQATPYQGDISGGCFVAGTRILLSDLSEKSIETIKINDSVLDYHMKPARVSHVHIFAAKQTYKLTFSNNVVVTTTDSHPFLSTTGWKSLSPTMTKQESPDLEVDDLHIGDTFYTFNDSCILLSIEKQEIQQVYNITVEKTHTYFANKFVTHNIKGGATFTPTQQSGGGGSMSTGGVGGEAVQLTHTFTANVQWEANNLEKQFTAAAQWAASNLQKEFNAVANWAVSGLEKTLNAVANWVANGLEKTLNAVANWVASGLQNTFNAIASWVASGLENTFNAVASWVASGLENTFNAVASWAANGLEHTFNAAASWAANELEHTFNGVASWAATGLEHTFNAAANWVSSNLSPTFFIDPSYTMLAEGTENFAGGPALVAEAGSPEVVAHNGNYMLYDRPTFLDLPSGSSVLPLRNMPSSSSLAMYGQGTGGDNVLPLTIPLGSGGQTANIHLYLDSQPFLQALSVPLSQNIRLNMGLRAY